MSEKVLIDRELLEDLYACATVAAHMEEDDNAQRANWYLGTARRAEEALAAPQQLVLPERKNARVNWDYADGWNDCLDEVQRLNKGASHE